MLLSALPQQSVQDFFSGVDFGNLVLNLIAAVAILVVGYLVAKLLAVLVRRGLGKTSIDERLGRSLADHPSEAPRVSYYVSRGVFWLVMVFVLVAFLQVLNLTFVTEPLNRFLGAVMEYLPQLLAAAALVLVAWVVATVLSMLTRRALEAADVDARIGRGLDGETEAPTGGGTTVSERPPTERPPAGRPSAERPPAGRSGDESVSVTESLATAVYYLVWLLFLPAILSTLELQGLLAPVENMVNVALNFLPNLLAAALIGVIGYFVARLVRSIVVNLSAAAGADRLAARLGVSNALGEMRLSQVLGLIAYVFVLIPVIVAALNALNIEAVTEPASQMLNQILAALPQIFAAALILAIAYVVGKLVAGLVSNLLAGVGFDRWLARLGLAREEAVGTERGPSHIVGTLVLVAVLLFAVMEAAEVLGFTAITALVGELLVFAGEVIVGLIVFGVGLYLANLAYRAVQTSDLQQATLLAVGARVAIIILAGAMALRQMGLANSIINLAFGLTLGAAAVAAAIAFGLGGRDFAHQQLERIESRVDGAPDVFKPSEGAPGRPPAPAERREGRASPGESSPTG